jgi:NAD+ kinase
MVECRRALLFINLHKSHARLLGEEITRELERRNIETVSFGFEGKPDFKVQGAFDISFSLGGDGTVLYASRTMAPLGVPVMPVNQGTLGFIAAVTPGSWIAAFDRWLAGGGIISSRLMLEVRVERQGKAPVDFSCLNDAVISASGIAKLIRLQVDAETGHPGERGEPVRLGQYRSDGLIVSTPTGSTGYSVAAGGPIIDPEMEAVIINPICPFTLSNRPVVMPADKRVIVRIEQEQRSAVLLTMDGQITQPLEPGDRIFITKAPYRAKLIESDREVFYRALRTKLNWSQDGFSAEGAGPSEISGGYNA